MFKLLFTKTKPEKKFVHLKDIDKQPSLSTDKTFVHLNEIDKPSLSLELTPSHDTIGISADKKSVSFCATVTARNLPNDESTRVPVDIIVVLDVSGSMSGSKLELCKTTISLLLQELRASDRFGLVTFGSTVKLEISTQELTKANRKKALAKIKTLETSGSTNMSGGIGMAAQEMKSIKSPHQVRTVFLLTDGQANQGISDREDLVKYTKDCLGSDAGEGPISIHCFGYGKDHDRRMLRDISIATEGGTYYYISNDSDVSSAFGDALGGVLSIVAQNTIVSLKVPQPLSDLGVSILKVNHNKAVKNSDGSYSVKLNDFYAEESRDIVFEITLSSKCDSAPVVYVVSSILYLDTINSMLIHSDDSQGSIARPLGDKLSAVNQHVVLQCIRIKTTEVITEAEKLADDGQLDAAKKTVASYIDQLQQEAELFVKSNPFIIQMLEELNSIMTGLSSPFTYEAEGASYLQSRILSHTTQRCTESSEESRNIYRPVTGLKYILATRMKKSSKK